MTHSNRLDYGVGGLLPTFGFRLEAVNENYGSRVFNIFTNPNYRKTGFCLNCGAPFLQIHSDKRQAKFCSKSCAAKYNRGKVKEANLRLAYNTVDKTKFSEFFKKYNGFILAKIHEQKSEYWEDLTDLWHEKAIWYFRKIRTPKPSSIMAFLSKTVIYNTMCLHRARKEVFYSECPIKAQRYILGEFNDERN